MSDPASNESSLTGQPPGTGSARYTLPRVRYKGDYRTGPKLDPQGLERLTGIERAGAEHPTWRGWMVGLGSVALISWFTPHVEFYLHGSFLTINLLTPGPMITLLLLLALQALIYHFAGRMALTRPDLTLITCMGLISAAIPGYGFMAYATGTMAGAEYYQPKGGSGGDWQELIFPYLRNWLVPHDPPEGQAGPRPIAWMMRGLDPGERFPWGAWILPYGLWALMALCVFGLMFSVCSVLRKQWADRERLPFPLAQVPLELLEGLPGTQDRKKPFLQDASALLGMAIPFTLHSWNSINHYFPKWPQIPLQFKGLHQQYLTEPPLNALGPLDIFIFPAVIGLTYLISLEVSFSLWFFYWVMKLCAFIGVQLGLGKTHADFQAVGGHKGFLIDQGCGALIAMVLFGVWMSRTHLAEVFLRALGLKEEPAEDEGEGLSSRGALLLFTVCFLGAVIWLMAAGIGLGYAMLTIVAMVIILTGITRLACEGGLFYIQSQISPAELLEVCFTPMGLGPQTLVPLGMWSRVFVFDWGRNSPIPAIMHSFKLSSDARVRKRPVVVGMALAILLALSLGFVGFMRTAYSHQGGATALEGGNSWTMGVPNTDLKLTAKRVQEINDYDRKFDIHFGELAVYAGAPKVQVQALREQLVAERRQGGRERLDQALVREGLLTPEQVAAIREQNPAFVPQAGLPGVAKYDFQRIFWLVLGGVVMLLFMLIRTRIFWWPHPMGYVTWMHPVPMQKLWFSIFLGWLLKWGITQYGGYRVYNALRRFFIGLAMGELAAAGFWIAVAWIVDEVKAYGININ